MKKKFFVTCALPYANSSIHIGHLVEHFLADFWVRSKRMSGASVYFICADDTHGTPVMISAQKRGLNPEALIAEVHADHLRDFKSFGIDFTYYGSTHSQENRFLCERVFAGMLKNQQIQKSVIEQLYCPKDQMFLPDRFVKGICPKCEAENQYGDSCDRCGATYSPSELKNSRCAHCGTPPELRESEHLLFDLKASQDKLKSWIPRHTSPAVSAKMMEWFTAPLRAWDISRDEPYFGFEIPGHPKKYFYVWVDAPLGYFASLQIYLEQQGQKLETFLSQPELQMIHVIGKDIVYFHTLFWPAMLMAGDFKTPDWIQVHGHLTVAGEKMSKSKGTQIQAQQFLKFQDPEHLRYYFASKLNSSSDDFDFSFEEFESRVNSELVGKITNLGSRAALFLEKNFASQISAKPSREVLDLLDSIQKRLSTLPEIYERWEVSQAISLVRECAEEANRFIDAKAPWKLVKGSKEEKETAQQVLSVCLCIFRGLAIGLKPVLPQFTYQVEALFQEKAWSWTSLTEEVWGQKIGNYHHLTQRVDAQKLKELMMEMKNQSSQPPSPAVAASSGGTPPLVAKPAAASESSQLLHIDDFMKVDLRIARILRAEAVPEAEKLLKLQVDLGDLGTRQIFAGIKAAYDPSALEGRLTLVVANLAPRKMKFGLSEGMVLAAGAGGKDLFILSPDSGAKPGDRVK